MAPGLQTEQNPAETQEHIPMADRLNLVSWGNGSVPSLPSVDEGSDNVSITSHLVSMNSAEETFKLTSEYSCHGQGNLEEEVASLKSSTMSVRSSIYEHVEENGRTYHRYKQGSKDDVPNRRTCSP
ncbi:hypothetical protein VTK73DRAFT_5329 [Phialemonium thermophilum]|uniref:Uncharacterized protein n=1 Tax=Phialemonium thermophilum TaxID=223376 RepID=A0ABR3Y806_9PEZI